MRTDRTVLVTGAAGAMGSLFVARFLANGDTVIATDGSPKSLELLKLTHAGAALHVIEADIADEQEVNAVSQFAKAKTGRIDILINCAGYFPSAPFEEISLEMWQQIIAINLTGVFLVTKAVLPLMRDNGWGRIVNIGSASEFEGVATQAHYVAAKSGVTGFSRSIARAFGQYGITVNIVAPGLTITPAVRTHLPRELQDAQIATRAIQREQVADDLVGAVFFLASPDADFVSGQTITVDGGRHMG